MQSMQVRSLKVLLTFTEKSLIILRVSQAPQGALLEHFYASVLCYAVTM